MIIIEILIVIVVLGAAYYFVRQMTSSKNVGIIGLKRVPSRSGFYSRSKLNDICAVIAGIGRGFVGLIGGAIGWVGEKLGPGKIKGLAQGRKKVVTTEEDLVKQLKKPEDRAFWTEAGEPGQEGGTAHLISKTYFEQAEEAFAKSDYRKAESLYLEAAREKPNDSKIFNRLGVIYLEYKKFDEAVESFEVALKLDSSVASRHFNLALALMGNGNYIQARVSLENAIKLAPGNDKYKKVLEEVTKKC